MDVKRGKEEVLLLSGVRSGDNQSVERLYNLYYPVVQHYILKNQGDDDEAAEIYQQAFIVLYERLQDEDFELHSSAGTFLYAVARNLWLAHLKERRRFVAEAEEQISVSPVEDEAILKSALQQERDLARMERCLHMLGEPCRTLLRHFYHEGLSMEQIAAKMQYTNADTAKNQKYKCLQRLKKVFASQTTKENKEYIEGDE